MILLILAAILWVFVHIGVSGTSLRDAIVARVGERIFSVVFSVASVLAIVALAQAWQGRRPRCSGSRRPGCDGCSRS